MSEEFADAAVDEVVSRLLEDTSTPDVVRAAEANGGYSPAVWQALADAGMPWISVNEAAGGSGGTVAQALRVLHHAGRCAAPVPLAETGLLAGWLLAGADMKVSQRVTTIVPGRREDRVSLVQDSDTVVLDAIVHKVPWGRHAEDVVLLADLAGRPHVVRVPTLKAVVKEERNIAGEPRDQLSFQAVRLGSEEVAPAGPRIDRDALLRRGAMCRAALMAGAMERVTELAVEHAETRHQFSRPIARFQAIQQHLVCCAEETQLAAMAAAMSGLLSPDGPDLFAAATAKIVAGDGATVVAARAHQVHGAMGMTQEHELHLRTRRLWAWSAEFGPTEYWRRRLGEQLFVAGADALWPRLATGLVE